MFCFKGILLAAFSFMLMINTSGQSARKVSSQLSLYMAAVKAKTEKPDLSELFVKEKSQEALLSALSGYYADTTYNVRLEAYRLTYAIANKSEGPGIRQGAVTEIVKAINNKNRSLSGWAVTRLSVFQREDFTGESKNKIGNGISTNVPKRAELIKVAGYLKIEAARAEIKQIAAMSGKISEKLAAYLALARMGDEEYIQKVTNLVKRQELNDDIVYELVPGLIYTRQKECINYVVETLYENKKKCMSSDPDNPQRIQCGYRIMEYLAPVIKDFPYGVKTSGDLDTGNYKEALEKVREWFLQMGNDYQITDTSF